MADLHATLDLGTTVMEVEMGGHQEVVAIGKC